MLACDMPELHRQAAAGSTGFELLMGYGKVVHALLASGAELSEDLQVCCVAQLRVFRDSVTHREIHTYRDDMTLQGPAGS